MAKRDAIGWAAYAGVVGATLLVLAAAGRRAEAAALERARASADDGPQPPVLGRGGGNLHPGVGATITVYAERPGAPPEAVDAEVARLLDARWYDILRIPPPPGRAAAGGRHYRITGTGIEAGLPHVLAPGVTVWMP